MKKTFTSIAFVVAIACAGYAQEDDQKEASVLKSEIKALEKAIGDTEKEIVKLEKSVVKTRPEAEQAKRDHVNITEMLENKRREAESFQYDKKKAELKTQQKTLAKVGKTQAKLQKSLDKNDIKQKEADREYELAKTQQTRTQTALDGVAMETGNVSREEQQAMSATLKSKEPAPADEVARARAYEQKVAQGAALQKELKSTDKVISKTEATRSKIQQERSSLLDEKKVVDEEQATLQTAVTALEEELKQFDPKMVQKEIEKLAKEADAARINAEKLQLELDQVEVQIKEKHDYIETKKIEVRDKQSALLKK